MYYVGEFGITYRFYCSFVHDCIIIKVKLFGSIAKYINIYEYVHNIGMRVRDF